MADMMPVTEMVQRVQEILTDVRNETWDSHDFTAQDADALAGLLRVVAMVPELEACLAAAYSELWRTYGETPRIAPLLDRMGAAMTVDQRRQALHETTPAKETQ